MTHLHLSPNSNPEAWNWEGMTRLSPYTTEPDVFADSSNASQNLNNHKLEAIKPEAEHSKGLDKKWVITAFAVLFVVGILFQVVGGVGLSHGFHGVLNALGNKAAHGLMGAGFGVSAGSLLSILVIKLLKREPSKEETSN